MERELFIFGIIKDLKNYYFFISADLDLNKACIYHLDEGLLPSGELQQKQAIRSYFGKEANHHMYISSEALVKLTDRLGNVYVDGIRISGRRALELTREGQLEKIAEGLFEALKTVKNPIAVLPNMLNALKDTFDTDFQIREILKIVLSEVGDFKDWRAEFVQFDAEHINQNQ